MPEIEIQGEQVKMTTVQAGTRLPPGHLVPERGRGPFLVVHHHNWEFIDDLNEWLPEVVETETVPGSNGTGISGIGKDARIDDRKLRAGINNKLSVEIKRHDPRLGEFADFLSYYTLTTGPRFYCYSWVKFSLINNGRNAVPKPDRERMMAFRRKILTSGIVEPMPRAAIETARVPIRDQQQRWTELRDAGKMEPNAYAERMKAADDRLARMDAAWSRQFGAKADTVVVQQAAEKVEDDPFALGTDEIPAVTETSEQRSTRSRKG